MPLPKRRHSNARTRIRRAHDALTVPGYTHCSHCDAVIRPHSICDVCGHYKDKLMIKIKEKKAPKSKS